MTRIKLALAEDIKNFVNETRNFESDINVHKGSYVVDGKSILGLLSINMADGADIEILSKDSEEIERFKKMLNKFSN